MMLYYLVSLLQACLTMSVYTKMGQLDCHLALRELQQFLLAMWQELFRQFWKIPSYLQSSIK